MTHTNRDELIVGTVTAPPSGETFAAKAIHNRETGAWLIHQIAGPLYYRDPQEQESLDNYMSNQDDSQITEDAPWLTNLWGDQANNFTPAEQSDRRIPP